MPDFVTEYPSFFTDTNLEWKKLLQPDKYKNIAAGSLRFLAEDKRIRLFAFVLMANHIHLIWQMQPLMHPVHVQRDFMKYTTQKIKHDLRQHHPSDGHLVAYRHKPAQQTRIARTEDNKAY